jgi:hypothetical protein
MPRRNKTGRTKARASAGFKWERLLADRDAEREEHLRDKAVAAPLPPVQPVTLTKGSV